MHFSPSKLLHGWRVSSVQRMIATLLALLFVHASSVATPMRAVAAPSLDCKKARAPVEVSICSDSALRAGDGVMAQLYAATKVSALGLGPSNELAEQRQWLKQRTAQCGGPERHNRIACLRGYQDQRNLELAVAALFRRPDLALRTLYQLDPKGAPLIEAVYVFANEPPGTSWDIPQLAKKRGHLLDLIRSFVARFEHDDTSAHDTLRDFGIVTAEDAVKSEEAFASFVQIASAFTESSAESRFVPCEAFVRHPMLIKMEDEAFGSTEDIFVIRSDCSATLPPTPKLTQLVETINNSWPKCEGTIRFGDYRRFATSVDAAKLGTEADLRGTRLTRIPQLKGVPSEEVTAAVAELAAYFRQYGRTSPERAPALANAMIRNIMMDAHICE